MSGAPLSLLPVFIPCIFCLASSIIHSRATERSEGGSFAASGTRGLRLLLIGFQLMYAHSHEMREARKGETGMKLAELVLSGTVTDISERSGSNDRGPWSITTAYLVGARRAYQVTLPDDLVGRVFVGEDVDLYVYPRVYNGVVDFAATGFAPSRAA